MKLAMRLPEKGRAIPDADPREEAGAEIIDLASRMAYPVVSQRKGRSEGLALAAGVAFVAVLGAATLWGLNSSRMSGEQAPPPPAVQPAAPPAPAIAPPTPEQQAAIAESTMSITPDPAPAPVLASAHNLSVMPVANPYSSPTVIFDAGPSPTLEVNQASARETTQGLATTNAPSDFASRIGGIGGAPTTAVSNFDPATTVTQGTMIPAVLETAINTDIPGYVRAVVSQDVRSYDGRRILVPRSSRLIGQYQSGLQAGQKRAYVIWTRLIRPDGISVALASPGTAFDGSGGLPGKVDTHFFQRFGSAMLLSVIGGLGTIAGGGSSVILGGGQNVASTALQQGGQIAPTVRVRMGEPIRVFTARDLDFSQAPQLK